MGGVATDHVPDVFLLAVKIDRADLLGEVLLECRRAGILGGAARRHRTTSRLALIVYLSLIKLTGCLGPERRPGWLDHVGGDPGDAGRHVLLHREPPHRSRPVVQLFVEPRNNCGEGMSHESDGGPTRHAG